MICEHCAHEPTYKAREAQQQPFRGMWNAIVVWEAEQNPQGEPSPLRAALHRIADEQPGAAEAFALATTRYGREDDKGE